MLDIEIPRREIQSCQVLKKADSRCVIAIVETAFRSRTAGDDAWQGSLPAKRFDASNSGVVSLARKEVIDSILHHLRACQSCGASIGECRFERVDHDGDAQQRGHRGSVYEFGTFAQAATLASQCEVERKERARVKSTASSQPDLESPEDIARQNAGFLGGPPEVFDEVGREQLAALLHYGLTMSSFVLDIGCGCLRGGRWIIPLLEPGHYCGIEPMKHMVVRGLRDFVPHEIAKIKHPRFDHNDRFDFGVFSEKFSHFIARSIWTHASKGQIEQMMDGVAKWGTDDVVFLASFRPARLLRYGDYKGDEWVGKSHESAESGMVAHKMSWIRGAAAKRGLSARLSDRRPVNGQPWCVMTRAKS